MAAISELEASVLALDIDARVRLILALLNSLEKDENVQLTWKADFVDVSASGDLGYTYGEYTYTYKDEAGNTLSEKGIFHTVWKRQKNGDWRFVWD